MELTLPERPPKPNLYYVTVNVYNKEVFRIHIPEEASISYPVPGGEQGEGVLYYFHYWLKTVPDRKLLCPLSKIVAKVKPEPEWAELIHCELASRDFPLFSQIPDHDSAPGSPMTGQEKRNTEIALYVACEELLKTVPTSRNSEAARIYVTALERLSLPGLLPFYRALNPELWGAIGL